MSTPEILFELKTSKNKQLGRIVKKDFEESQNIYGKLIDSSPGHPQKNDGPNPVTPKFEPIKLEPPGK
jgi:hypothetical protein